MADNNNKMSPKDRARYNYEHKKEFDKLYTSKDRAKDNYKIHKEYKKLEKRDKLPSFIITIIVFVLFIGIFAGLYTQYDYTLKFNPKEQTDIDVSTPSKVLSGQISNAFLSFFISLENVSNLADSAINFISSNNDLSDDVDVNLYLLNLKQIAIINIENSNDNAIRKFTTKQSLNKIITAYANKDYSFLPGFTSGMKHRDNAHLYDLVDLSSAFGWTAHEVHEKFVELEICHIYLDVEYYYCS